MQYITALVVPLALLITFRTSITSLNRGFKFAFISALGMYIISIATAFIISMILEFQLESFDLNHDNVFSGHEQTLPQQIAMDAVINDVGRNLTFAFAIPWSLLVSISIFIPLGFFGAKKSKTEING